MSSDEIAREIPPAERRIKWYRCKIDRQLLSGLMEPSDARGFRQVLPQLALFAVTSAVTYLAFSQIAAQNWWWSVPLLLAAFFVHGTFSGFLGTGGPVHELSHKTAFRTRAWNEFFLKVYSFLSWTDYVGFRPSHVRHHQVTVHHDLDGEVVLPQKFDWQCATFFFSYLVCNPREIYSQVRNRVEEACSVIRDPWMQKVLAESAATVRIEHRRWARTLVGGHLILMIVFVAIGHPFLIPIVNFGSFFAKWFVLACARPQHLGMSPDVDDFRLCCRTYTCSWLPAFLYWNMQYHVEHHMFPAVPFYNLPRLRAAIAHDLPPAPHGLWATWREILPILRRQKDDPTYALRPVLPTGTGDCVSAGQLQKDAAPPELAG